MLFVRGPGPAQAVGPVFTSVVWHRCMEDVYIPAAVVIVLMFHNEAADGMD